MRTTRPQRLVGALLALGVVAALTSGCSSSSPTSAGTAPGTTSAAKPSGSAAGGTTAKTTPPSTSAVVCDGDDEVNEDDDGAMTALVKRPQLPGGDVWTVASTPPCPWALSVDEVLSVGDCRAIGAAAGAPPNAERRNGNGRITFARSDGVQFDDRIEIYTSRENVDTIRAILASPTVGACYEAATVARAAREPGASVSNVVVEPFSVQPDAATLGLGFPAVEGYPADEGFARGVQLSFDATRNGTTDPVTMRIVTFGAGGLVSTVTVIGESAAQLDAVDLPGIVTSSANAFKTMYGTGP